MIKFERITFLFKYVFFFTQNINYYDFNYNEKHLFRVNLYFIEVNQYEIIFLILIFNLNLNI